jgi:hypothetical protein
VSDEARTLVVSCGALARELRTVLAQMPGGTDHYTVIFLPSNLHNRPTEIPAAVERAVIEAGPHDHVFVAYADCGTGGLLDPVVTRLGATRLPGAHCYEFFAGPEAFAHLSEREPGTFYLTDFLARHFDALVFRGLGLDRHPELRDQYFGHYSHVVLLSQSDDPNLIGLGQGAADRLGLAFVHHPVGLVPFTAAIGTALDRVGT